MEYYHTINAHILGETVAVKTIKADEANSLPKAVLTRLRQSTTHSNVAKTLSSDDIVAVLNIRTCRLLKLTGKIWDQLSSGDDIWMLTAKEWKEHSENVLIHECKVRHGKTLMIRNPAALNPKQVFDMVDAYFPDMEKKYSEAASPVPSPLPRAKPVAAVAVPTKKSFLKAYTGSPYRPPVPYSDKRKQQQDGEPSLQAGSSGDAKPLSGKKRSPSPVKSADRNLATSNRQQTVFPPLSPTLLRRVGLGSRLQQEPQQQHQQQRFQHTPDADTSVLTNDEVYADAEGGSPGALEEAFDGEASPEQKIADNADDADFAASAMDEIHGNSSDNNSTSSSDLYSSSSAPPPAPTDQQLQEHTEQQQGAGGAEDGGVLGDEAEGEEEEVGVDYLYFDDGAEDEEEEEADEVMLGAGDDGTLTTVTNSVMDCFSLQDPSVSPRSSIHPGSGHHSRRGSANNALLEAGLAQLVEDGAHAVVRDAVMDMQAHNGDEEQEPALPIEGDLDKDNHSANNSVGEGGNGTDDDSSVSSAPHPLVPTNSRADGEPDRQHDLRDSPTLSLSTAQSSSSSGGFGGSNRDFCAESEKEEAQSGLIEPHTSMGVPPLVPAGDLLTEVKPAVRTALEIAKKEGNGERRPSDAGVAVMHLELSFAPPAACEGSQVALSDLLDALGPSDPNATLGGFVTEIGGMDGCPPLQWQMTEESGLMLLSEECVQASPQHADRPLQAALSELEHLFDAGGAPAVIIHEAGAPLPVVESIFAQAPARGLGFSDSVYSLLVQGGEEDSPSRPPLRWQMTEEEDFEIALDPPQPPPASGAAKAVAVVASEVGEEEPAVEAPGAEVNVEEEGSHHVGTFENQEQLRTAIGLDEETESSECVDVGLVTPASEAVEATQCTASDEAQKEELERVVPCEEPGPLHAPSASLVVAIVGECGEERVDTNSGCRSPFGMRAPQTISLKANPLVTPAKAQVRDSGDQLAIDHETSRTQHYSRLGGACFTGSALRRDSRRSSIRRDEAPPTPVSTEVDGSILSSALAVAPTQPEEGERIAPCAAILHDGQVVPPASDHRHEEVLPASDPEDDEEFPLASGPEDEEVVSTSIHDGAEVLFPSDPAGEDVPPFSSQDDKEAPPAGDPDIGEVATSWARDGSMVEEEFSCAAESDSDLDDDTADAPSPMDDTAPGEAALDSAQLDQVNPDDDNHLNTDLTFSEDLQASAGDRGMLGMYTSAAAESTDERDRDCDRAQPATSPAQVTAGSQDDTDSDEQGGVDRARSSSSSIIGATLVTEADDGATLLTDLTLTRTSERLTTSPVGSDGEGATIARKECASPKSPSQSPLLASSSQMISLSPDRELESTTRFIPRAAMESSQDVSEEEAEAEDEVEAEAAREEAGADASSQEAFQHHQVTPPATVQQDCTMNVDVGTACAGEGEGEEEQSCDAMQDMQCAMVSSSLVTSPVAQPAHTSLPSSPKSSTEVPAVPAASVSTEATSELEDRLRRQAEELAEASRVKAALEARLDETRQLLQIFAAGRAAPYPLLGSPTHHLSGSAVGAGSSVGAGLSGTYLGTDIDIDALENTLKYVSVGPEAAPDAPSDGLGLVSQLATPMSPDSHSSSGNTTKMRKSLRRLLERKREEKLRLAVADEFGSVPRQDRPYPTSSGRTPVKAVRTKPRGVDGGDSSDSAFSGPESRGGGRTTRGGFDAAGRPTVGFAIRKEPLRGKTAAPPLASSVTAGIAESLDDLDMSITAIRAMESSSFKSESAQSSARATPTVAVVSLELGNILQSHSSDLNSSGSLFGQSGTRTGSDDNLTPPPPPPPHVSAASVTSLSAGTVKPLTISLPGLPELPPNLHIVSPRHLAVTLSSSSEDANDVALEEEGTEQHRDLESLSSVPVSPPSSMTFSPLNSSGKANQFSPRQLGVKSPEPHRSPVLEVLRVTTEGRSTDVHIHSDDESSVESNNPLLLESTPKIRGFARRAAAYGQQQQQLFPLVAPSTLSSFEVSKVGTRALGIASVIDEKEMHGQFFRDTAMGLSGPVARASTDEAQHPLKGASESTFLYDYNTYHKLRPDLFLDSGPNSPFNPQSLFMHGGHLPVPPGQNNEDGTEGGAAGIASNAYDGQQPPRRRLLSETELNTAANASSARQVQVLSRQTSSARVSFGPGEDGDGADISPAVGGVASAVATQNDAVHDQGQQGEEDLSPPPPPPSQVSDEEARSLDQHNMGGESLQTPEKSATTAMPAAAGGIMVHPPLRVDVELPPASVPSTPCTAALDSGAGRFSRQDKLAPLLAYFQPFLVTERYLESPHLRGQAGRMEVLRSVAVRDTISWCVFQTYGTADGAMVKGIKMIQVVRALKDAEVCTSITTSHLDLLLTKIHVAAAKGSIQQQSSTPTSAAIASVSGASRVLRRTVAAHSTPASTSMHSAGSNSSKGEQNSNSLAGASFPTFCALMNAIAGIVYSADPKIRVRVIKKGVTLGDLTHYYTTPVEEHEAANARLEGMWRALLERRDHQDTLRALQESHISASGLLLRGIYRRCSPLLPAVGCPSSAALEGGSWSPLLVRTLPEADLDLIRHVWERNSDQIRQIYGFYAMSKDARRQGSGPSKLLLGFEHCREALVDFQVLPHVVDAQGYARLFKVVKLWELHVAEQLLVLAHQAEGCSAGSGVAFFGHEAAGMNDALNLNLNLNLSADSSSPKRMTAMSPVAGAGAAGSVADGSQSVLTSSSDPLDFKGSVGNLSLSLTGFMELLTRIALGHQKLGVRPHEALENLMHIMDASEGKGKLIKASRKSTSVRHFVYGVK